MLAAAFDDSLDQMHAMASDQPPTEVLLGATSGELHALRRRLLEDSGRIAMRALTTVAPYERMVPQLAWHRSSGLITISLDGEALQVSGGPEAFELLVANLRVWAGAGSGDHFHVEFYPGHPWLEDSSVSLVIELL